MKAYGFAVNKLSRTPYVLHTNQRAHSVVYTLASNRFEMLNRRILIIVRHDRYLYFFFSTGFDIMYGHFVLIVKIPGDSRSVTGKRLQTRWNVILVVVFIAPLTNADVYHIERYVVMIIIEFQFDGRQKTHAIR